MRRSIKITLTLAFLVGIYFLLPYFFGMMTKRYTTQFVNNENITLGKVFGIQLNITQYHRGWFSSDAVLQIERQNSVGDWELSQSIPLIIQHGPSFDFGDHKVAGVGMISAMGVPLMANSPYKLNIQEVVGFAGERGTVVFLGDKANPAIDGFRINSLVMNVRSNLKADRFVFKIAGKELHIDDPQQSLSADIGDFNVNLDARYLDDRHWQMTAGFLSNNDTISMLAANGGASNVAVHADLFSLDRLHLDTKEMAKLLAELVQIKDASDAQQPISPSAWMALFQQLLVQLVHNDTAVSLQGLSVKTPMGELQLHYDVAFPSLPQSHDYFDIATHGVGQLKMTVPHWSYTFAEQNKELSLSDLQYLEKNNTVFSRHSNLSFGAFDVTDSTERAKAPLFYAAGFSYQGDLQGSIDNLSQLMDWKMAKLCWSGQCFNQLEGELKLMHMDYDAFRGIAAATQQIVQFDPSKGGSIEAKWADLATAYAKLVSAKTTVDFLHQMKTPGGTMALHATVSWPGLKENMASSNLLSTVLDQSVYQLHLQFPAIYVDGFLDEQANASRAVAPKTPVEPVSKPVEPPFGVQVADFLKYAIQQGYLKKTGDAYQSDLSGKGTVFTINGAAWKSPAAS